MGCEQTRSLAAAVLLPLLAQSGHDQALPLFSFLPLPLLEIRGRHEAARESGARAYSELFSFIGGRRMCSLANLAGLPAALAQPPHSHNQTVGCAQRG